MQHYRGSSVGFPGGASGKEPARRCRGARSIPGTGRSSGGRPARQCRGARSIPRTGRSSGGGPARQCRGARSIPGTGRSSGGGPHSAVSLEKPVAARPQGQGDRGLDTRPLSRGTEGRTRGRSPGGQRVGRDGRGSATPWDLQLCRKVAQLLTHTHLFLFRVASHLGC